MNRLLAKLFPRHFRRVVQIDIPLSDWFELRDMLNKPKKEFAAGDKFNLVDENTGTVIKFDLTPGKKSAEKPTTRDMPPMRWQDLIYLKCPKCSAHLEAWQSRTTMYRCKTEGCDFLVDRDVPVETCDYAWVTRRQRKPEPTVRSASLVVY